ncbi:MAG: glycosyltransferase family 2 protein [Ignavibacteriae bacterium]|nr:glycosyltransferase family 2 protein [Ignavibacteriota bacterium]
MIYIVIPNWNGLEHIKDCFPSLFEQTHKNYVVVMVDNSSEDNSVAYVKEKFPQVMVLELETNRGFAGGVNEGIRFAQNFNPDYILLLNNDIECTPTFLEEMAKGFKTEDTGSAACKMLNYYNRMKIDDAGDFIKKKGSPYARGHGEIDQGQYNEEEFIFGPCAGAAMYRSGIFDEIGYFDEDFFAYYEDVDFSFRMQLAGYKCFYNPKAVCYHKRGASTEGNHGFQTMLCEKNLVAIRLKNYPSSIYLRYLPYFFVVRFKRYYGFYQNQPKKVFWSAVKGYFKGLMEMPKSYSKRKKIQQNAKVSPEYIESLFTP